ncbi:ClpXP protease specificity-enhancing factor, partial [Vibrio sp. Y184]|nr:ClpXP protease specificity-enhancing factor [Vibrio sp. Y184]
MFEPEEAYTHIEEETIEEDLSPSFKAVTEETSEEIGAESKEEEAPRPKGRPSLRVIK